MTSRFAFITYPATLSEAIGCYPFLRRFRSHIAEAVLRRLPSVIIDEIPLIQSSSAETSGSIIAAALTCQEVKKQTTDWVLRKIIAACRKAERLGAEFVGLSMDASGVGDAGITIARHLMIPVTTGDSLRLGIAVQSTLEACRKMGIISEEAVLTIINGAASTGKTVGCLLAPAFQRIVLTGGGNAALEKSAFEIYQQTGVLADICINTREAVQKSKVIVITSDSIETVLFPDDVVSGAVVVEMVKSRSVAQLLCDLRDDVLVIDGGWLSFPGDHARGDGPIRDAWIDPGMVEAAILALEKRRECFTLGRLLRFDQVAEITHLAKKHGFMFAGLQRSRQPIDDDIIAKIRNQAISKRKKNDRSSVNVLT